MVHGVGLMADYQRLEVSEIGDVAVVHFVDRKILDAANIEELGRELIDLVERDKRPKIVLNFAAVEFLSSAALGKLITLHTKCKDRQTILKLCNIRPDIYDVFKITKLNKLFDIKEQEADALAAF